MKTKILADFQICIGVPLRFQRSEAIAWMSSVKKLLLKVSQNSQKTYVLESSI